MQDFQHFVITRFNIPVAYQGRANEKVKAVDPCTDVAYLEEHFRLFEMYTFPSMRDQTVGTFTWLVLLSEGTPQRFKDRLSKLGQELSALEPCYLSDEEAYGFNDYLSKRLAGSACDHVLTTRIDNDDAVARTFVQDLQEADAGYADGSVISYPHGLQLTEKNRLLVRQAYWGNHFISLWVAKSEATPTVISFSSTAIPESLERVSLDPGHPMWLEVIHGLNNANVQTLGLKNAVFSSRALDAFPRSVSWGVLDALRSFAGNAVYSVRRVLRQRRK